MGLICQGHSTNAPVYVIAKKFLTYTKLRDIMTMLQISGCSLVVELQPSKLIVWVRFPSSAPLKGTRK